jgi:hypothetical protein
MKAPLWIGLTMMVLGVISLLVPIPSRDRNSVEVAGVSVGVETESQEKVSPMVSAVLILGGAGMMIAQKVRG